MNKYLCFFLCLFYLSAKAQKTDDSVRKVLIIDTLSMVDWALNGDSFFLTTDKGIKASIGTKVYNRIKRAYSTDFILLDKNKNFLLIRAFYIGKFQALAFDVGTPKYMPKDKVIKQYKTKQLSFITNRGVFLGMTEDELIRKSKKLVYTISNEGATKVYSFSSLGISNLVSNYTRVYESKYYFENGKLIKYYFGLF